jgi:hypothetical protein
LIAKSISVQSAWEIQGMVLKLDQIALGTCMLLAFTSIAKAAPPSQLYGKSIKLDWTESRMQRKADESEFHSKSLGMYVYIYISSTGNIFNRFGVFSGGGARGGGKSGNSDQVAGEGRSNRGVSFRGNSLEFFQAFGGGARHVVATFDSTYGSCTATASYASDVAGGPKILAHTLISGERMEVKSLSGSGASCSVQNGNVFAQ